MRRSEVQTKPRFAFSPLNSGTCIGKNILAIGEETSFFMCVILVLVLARRRLADGLALVPMLDVGVFDLICMRTQFALGSRLAPGVVDLHI